MTAPAVLDREYFEIRAKLLELAASFDRLDRGDGSVADDPRMKLIQDGLSILQSRQRHRRGAPDRAETIQLLFSRVYEENWRENYGI